MGHGYQAVQWNPQKRKYDLAIAASTVLFLGLFVGGGLALNPEALPETLLLRGLAAAALIGLHVILCIGPLARLDRRWLPLLYNRRHLGVTVAILASLHGALALLTFHAFGDVDPITSLFTANTRWDSLAHFPFQPLGAIALLILVAMAATSHDFWLANLTAPVWKALHMLVYVAYALIVAHVALGVLQAETSPLLATLLGVGALGVMGLHGASASMDRAGERSEARDEASGWIDVCAPGDIPDGRAKIVSGSGERIAVFREGDSVLALSGVCQHQNGPLGEGRINKGVVQCPWHGYEYKGRCGRSPEPFQEVVPTFDVRINDGMVQVQAMPRPLGTDHEPLQLPKRSASESGESQ